MKKTLLIIIAGILSIPGFAQVSANNIKVLPSPALSKTHFPYDKSKIRYCDGSETLNNPSFRVTAPSMIQTVNAITPIGNTSYDLQSNSSVSRRVINHGAGKITAVWTMATTNAANWPNRGSGYNFFDGTGWGAIPSARLEGTSGTRTGWPNTGDLGSGKEIILAHDPNVYGFQQAKNASIGSNAFTFTASQASLPFSGPDGAIWGRIAISGAAKNYVHVLACAGDTNPTCKLAGVRQPIVYSRSNDEGATWTIHDITLPGYDSTMTSRGGADDYAIDAYDSIVAIVIGGLGESATLWKSTNNGDTFTKMYIDSFIFQPDITSSTIAVDGDSADTNDGSVTVMVDHQGVVHVAYPFSQVFLDNSSGTPAVTFKPGFETLVYWNDLTHTKTFLNLNLGDVDSLRNGGDENGNFDIGSNTTQGVVGGTVVAASRYGSGSIVGKPSIAGDNAGKLYIVFSLPHDGDSTADGLSFRDVWVRASVDNGANWLDPINLTCSYGVEEAFASVAKDVDTDLHIVFQSDVQPGTVLGNLATASQAAAILDNDIVYMHVPTTKILDQTAACAFNSIRKNESEVSSIAISENYPNPFTKHTNIDIAMIHGGDVSLTVTNILGQKMVEQNFSNMSAGKHTLDFDGSRLSKGVYFYTVKTGSSSVTKKMIVQ